MLIYIGTQGNEAGQGIFTARFNNVTGHLTPIGLAAEVARPTWLLRDPKRPFLYSVSELGNAGDRDGEVLSFAIDETDGVLRPIGRQPSGGGGPTHLDLAPDGETLFVANFGGGQVSTIPVQNDGSLQSVSSVQTNFGSGPHRRQQGPHAHGVTLDPSRRFVLAPDMGADAIFIYSFNPVTKVLSASDSVAVPLPAGSGPRYVLFGKDGRFAYLLTELSSELFVFAWDARAGCLTQIAQIALDPQDADYARSAAVMVFSADGRFLYLSNRVTHEIQVYAIDAETGLPNEVQRIDSGGLKPWGAAITPDGHWLLVANQGSDQVNVFAIDTITGELKPTEGSLSVPTPTAIAFAGTA